MPRYHKLGNIPHKRHTVFKNGGSKIHHEQLFGTIGFEGMSSLLYHIYPPTEVKEILKKTDISPKIAVSNNMQMRGFKGFGVDAKSNFLKSRVPILTNSDVTLHLANPSENSRDFFYKNVDADEVIFIHKGEGILRTLLGKIEFKNGDYLVIPRGMIYKMDFKDNNNRHFIIESSHPIYIPKNTETGLGNF